MFKWLDHAPGTAGSMPCVVADIRSGGMASIALARLFERLAKTPAPGRGGLSACIEGGAGNLL